MYIVFFLLLSILLLFVLFVKLPFNFTIVFDGLNLNGFMSLKFFSFRIMNIKIHIGKTFNIKKTMYISPFIKVEKYKDEGSKFLQHLLKKIKLKELCVFVDGGVKENAFVSAMVISSFIVFIKSVFGSLNHVQVSQGASVAFGDNIFILTSKVKFKLSIIEILLSLVNINKANKKESFTDNNIGE